MPRFSAHLGYLYNEHPFLERFASAARDGFRGVELFSPYDHPAETVAQAARDAGVEIVLFNTAFGDYPGGERGIGALPGREAEFRGWIDKAIAYAKVLGTPRVHVMAGIVPAGADHAAYRRTLIENLRWAAPRMAEAGLGITLEPINQRDMPGYFYSRQADGHAIREEVGAPNVQVQMDFYHCQNTEGDLAHRARQYIAHVGHVQIAGVPGRFEPDTGEINYPYLFALLDELGYGGWVGCEYRPKAGTSAGLGWLQAWREKHGG